MPMMCVRIMRVRMAQRRVCMHMHMRFRCGLSHIVLMLVVRVVHMKVIVSQARMRMLVIVALGEVQPEADHHQNSGGKQPYRDRLAQKRTAITAPTKGAMEK